MNGSLATFNDMDYFWPEVPSFFNVLERSLYYLIFVRFLLNCNLLEQGTNIETSPKSGFYQVHY